MDLSAPVIENALKTHKGYGFVITGHSLGGGTAELVTMSFLNDSSMASLIPDNTRIQCVVLAPPPVFRWSDGQDRYDPFHYKHFDNLYKYKHKNEVHRIMG